VVLLLSAVAHLPGVAMGADLLLAEGHLLVSGVHLPVEDLPADHLSVRDVAQYAVVHVHLAVLAHLAAQVLVLHLLESVPLPLRGVE